MPDPTPDACRAFPSRDSLCEDCGYPLRGLADKTHCPECGAALSKSSPGRRDLGEALKDQSVYGFLKRAAMFLSHPRDAFRRLPIDGPDLLGQGFLFWMSTLSALAFSLIWFVIALTPGHPTRAPVQGYSGFMVCFIAAAVLINLLTYMEMLGVTAISRRRGWRVPYRLAERVCCYASVGWLPGVLLAGAGLFLIDRFAVGRLWFNGLVGLVRVSWLCYGGVFVLSLLWFETLVWIGVRQVRFANAWPAEPVGVGPGAGNSDDLPAA